MKYEECYLKPFKELTPPEDKPLEELQELVDKLKWIPYTHAKEQVDLWVSLWRLTQDDRTRILEAIRHKGV